MHASYDERHDRDDRRAMQADDVGGLVKAAADGDWAAWTALVERFSGLVWATARAHRLSAADAEEVFQTTWLRLTEHIGRIKEPDRIGGWLATTARREAFKTLGAARRLTPVSELDALDRGTEDGSPEQAVLESEEAADRANQARRVWVAFQRLPERCRELLRVLIAAPPPSYAEISAALGMAVGSIGPTRARCLAQLRALMAGLDGAGGLAR
jgi:RNA polymerase sigma factor (sigma-70 family)